MLQTLAKHALAGAFDADEVAVLVDAFEQAWNRVEENGSIRVGDGHAEDTRELLALRIIEIAQLGERDPHRLRVDALAYPAGRMRMWRNNQLESAFHGPKLNGAAAN
jgi:hypothetical protein